jgi:hypothetical protein
MDIISAEEHEVLSFFEVVPTPTDKDIPWPYNDYLYEIEREGMSMSCAIAPAYKDVRIILKYNGSKFYELNSVGVRDVRYDNKGGNETLEIVLSDNESITLRVKPRIEINHHHSARFET